MTYCKPTILMLTNLINSKKVDQKYDISLDPFRWLFVVPDFAWKTKQKRKKLQFTQIQNSSACFRKSEQLKSWIYGTNFFATLCSLW